MYSFLLPWWFPWEAFISQHCVAGRGVEHMVRELCFKVLTFQHDHPVSLQVSARLFFIIWPKSEKNKVLLSIRDFPLLHPDLTMLVSACHQPLPQCSSSFVLRHASRRPQNTGSCMDTTVENQEQPGLPSHVSPLYLDIPCTRSHRVHPFVHLLKYEKNSCTDLNKNKKPTKKISSF